ncbi:MAG: hypothetical protein JXR31_17010 [Prolixibacteraceae bacterium]|nr:hypothetical protein [Prolixibacteraceae bacterium]MBN2775958.1 hypothetical protein [Prolixibacteraceae bacterium]
MTPEELLQKAKEFNDANENQKVIDLLPDDILRKLKRSDLYAESSGIFQVT